MRGTKFSCVGRASARSSRKVDRSLRAAKYTVPPLASVPYRTPRPITWLIGRKASVIAGSTPWFSSQCELAAEAPHVGDLALGVDRALGGAGAAGGVDEQCQRVVTLGDDGPRRGQRRDRGRARRPGSRRPRRCPAGAPWPPRGPRAGRRPRAGSRTRPGARGRARSGSARRRRRRSRCSTRSATGSVSATIGCSWACGALVCSGTDTAPSWVSAVSTTV